MIPILYEHNEREFKTNGVGRLNCTSCVVTEERNGVYECEFEIDMDDPIYSKIKRGMIIACTHDDRKDLQPFEIYGRTEPINGIVKFFAHHISYRLGKIILEPYTAGSCAQALSLMNLHSVNNNPFTFWTDKETQAAFSVNVPQSVKATLGGVDGSILDTFGGGEYEFDKYAVKLHQSRGQDSGVDIRFGKNLTSFSRDEDGSGTYNAVAPFWYQSEGNILITLPERVVVSDSIEELTGALITHTREPLIDENGDDLIAVYQADIEAVPLDLSDAFEEQPTEAQIRAKAQAVVNGTDTQEADETIEIDFVALWQTEEYKDVSPLQRLSLCDKANITHSKLGLHKYKAQIIKTEYDALKERYIRMTLGKPRASFAESIRAEVTETVLKQVPDMNTLQAALDYATELIKGGKGGYKVELTDADGHPTETLYMDSPNLETAVNILRINKNGIAFSNNGYDPERFVSAWTIDGHFNANFIDVGELNANLLKAGVIQDKAGLNRWDLTTGEISITYGSESESPVTHADLNLVRDKAQEWAEDAEDNAKAYADANFTTAETVGGMIQTSEQGMRTEFSGTYAQKNSVYSEIVEMYYKSTSPTQIFGGEWTRNYPTPEAGYYIWHKFLYYKLSGGEPDESTPSRLTGDAGTNGLNGADARYLYITSTGATSTAKEKPITATLTACVGKGDAIDEDPRGTEHEYGWFIKPDGGQETFYRRGKNITISVDSTLCEDVAALRFALIDGDDADEWFALQDATGAPLTTHTGAYMEV